MVLEKNSEIQTSQAYFQKWIAGQEAGGNGINIFFPGLINRNNYSLKQVYFRGMIGTIQSGKASYFAKLTYNNKDIIMSNDPNEEYGNTIPDNNEDSSFVLKDNECVISYIDNGETKYVKIKNIVEKESEYFPSASPRNNKE